MPGIIFLDFSKLIIFMILAENRHLAVLEAYIDVVGKAPEIRLFGVELPKTCTHSSAKSTCFLFSPFDALARAYEAHRRSGAVGPGQIYLGFVGAKFPNATLGLPGLLLEKRNLQQKGRFRCG